MRNKKHSWTQVFLVTAVVMCCAGMGFGFSEVQKQSDKAFLESLKTTPNRKLTKAGMDRFWSLMKEESGNFCGTDKSIFMLQIFCVVGSGAVILAIIQTVRRLKKQPE